jgi:hypothetical protein
VLIIVIFPALHSCSCLDFSCALFVIVFKRTHNVSLY